MKAIVETGGKQFYVTEEDVIYVEKLDAEVGSTVKLENVLFIDGVLGNPYVEGASVECKVDKHGKDKKIIVFKYRPKKKFRKKQCHRQPYTKLIVTKINK